MPITEEEKEDLIEAMESAIVNCEIWQEKVEEELKKPILDLVPLVNAERYQARAVEINSIVTILTGHSLSYTTEITYLGRRNKQLVRSIAGKIKENIGILFETIDKLENEKSKLLRQIEELKLEPKEIKLERQFEILKEELKLKDETLSAIKSELEYRETELENRDREIRLLQKELEAIKKTPKKEVAYRYEIRIRSLENQIRLVEDELLNCYGSLESCMARLEAK